MRTSRREAFKIAGSVAASLGLSRVALANSNGGWQKKVQSIQTEKQLDLTGFNPNQSVQIVTAPGVPHVTVANAFKLGLRSHGHQYLLDYLRVYSAWDKFKRSTLFGTNFNEYYDAGWSIGIRHGSMKSPRSVAEEYKFRFHLLAKYQYRKFLLRARAERMDIENIKLLKKMGFQILVVDFDSGEDAFLHYNAFEDSKLASSVGPQTIDSKEIQVQPNLLVPFKNARQKFDAIKSQYADSSIVLGAANPIQDLKKAMLTASMNFDSEQFKLEHQSAVIVGSL